MSRGLFFECLRFFLFYLLCWIGFVRGIQEGRVLIFFASPWFCQYSQQQEAGIYFMSLCTSFSPIPVEIEAVLEEIFEEEY